MIGTQQILNNPRQQPQLEQKMIQDPPYPVLYLLTGEKSVPAEPFYENRQHLLPHPAVLEEFLYRVVGWELHSSSRPVTLSVTLFFSAFRKQL